MIALPLLSLSFWKNCIYRKCDVTHSPPVCVTTDEQLLVLHVRLTLCFVSDISIICLRSHSIVFGYSIGTSVVVFCSLCMYNELKSKSSTAAQSVHLVSVQWRCGEAASGHCGLPVLDGSWGPEGGTVWWEGRPAFSFIMQHSLNSILKQHCVTTLSGLLLLLITMKDFYFEATSRQWKSFLSF